MGRSLPSRNRPDLVSLTNLQGPFATTVIPDLHDDACRDRVARKLARSGVPARVRSALDDAARDPYGPEVAALGVVLVEEGIVHLEAWPEAPADEGVWWDRAPALAPFVLADQREQPYVLVRVRAGVLDMLATGTPHLHLDLDADEDGLPTVRRRSFHAAPRVTRVPGTVGGSIAGSAAEVERAASQVDAEAVLVIGASEEVRELATALPPHMRSRLHHVEPGRDPAATDEAVAETLERVYEETNRFAVGTWSMARAEGMACGGLAPTLDALRDGRAVSVLVGGRLLGEVGASEMAYDLGLPPARCEGLPGRVPLADALVWSALSSGADVWVVEGPEGEALDEGTGAVFASEEGERRSSDSSAAGT